MDNRSLEITLGQGFNLAFQEALSLAPDKPVDLEQLKLRAMQIALAVQETKEKVCR